MPQCSEQIVDDDVLFDAAFQGIEEALQREKQGAGIRKDCCKISKERKWP